LFTVTQLPPGATAERSVAVARQIEAFYGSQPEVANVISVVGTNFFGAGQNMINSFIALKPWSERHGEEHSAQAVAQRAMGALMGIRDAFAIPINPPPIPELGNGVGFSVRLQDRAALGHHALLAARNQLLALAPQHPAIGSLRVEGVEDAPQLQLDVDRERAYALGVSFEAINQLFSTALGSNYVNDFPNAGRMQRVIVQADVRHRMQPEDLLALNVLNAQGAMVPLSAFVSTRWVSGPMQLVRYNGYPAYRLAGTAAPGYSTGEAMVAMESLMRELPAGLGYEWTGISREERISGAQMPLLMGLSILSVFLCLAALYESWTIPLAVMLVVPLGLLGSVLGVTVLGMSNDIYFKVGLIAIIGLSAKNAILIIEFARHLQAEGMALMEAIITACRQRLRPILMTSFAFILGVMPLATATGAGAAGQRAIGTGVMGGMISATVLAIFLVPVFFVALSRLRKDGRTAD
jgi:multidrug efflux pump